MSLSQTGWRTSLCSTHQQEADDIYQILMQHGGLQLARASVKNRRTSWELEAVSFKELLKHLNRFRHNQEVEWRLSLTLRTNIIAVINNTTSDLRNRPRGWWCHRTCLRYVGFSLNVHLRNVVVCHQVELQLEEKKRWARVSCCRCDWFIHM